MVYMHMYTYTGFHISWFAPKPLQQEVEVLV